MAHTPGPWEVYEGAIVGADRIDVIHSLRDPEELIANGYLMCAAPDLLEACEALLAGVESLPPLTAIAGVLASEAQQAHAAIAKARGNVRPALAGGE